MGTRGDAIEWGLAELVLPEFCFHGFGRFFEFLVYCSRGDTTSNVVGGKILKNFFGGFGGRKKTRISRIFPNLGAEKGRWRGLNRAGRLLGRG